MANEKKRYQQTTYGNVAYDLNYQRNVVPVPDGGEPSRQPRPRKHTRTGTRQRRRVVTRPKVKLRPREAVTPLAICGFGLATVMAVLVLFSYVKLNDVSANVVALQSQLTTLQTEENTLKAEYEEVFNQDVLSKAVKKAGNLKPISNDQVVYVELSDPDNIVVYEQEPERNGVSKFLESVRDILGLGNS